MGVPASACRIAYTICSSENFDRFMGPLLSSRTAEADILLQFQSAVVFLGDVKIIITKANSYHLLRILAISINANMK